MSAERKCWVVIYHEELARPFWGATPEEIGDQAAMSGIDLADDLIRMPEWDDRAGVDDITPREWIEADGLSYACAVCHEMVYTEIDTVWWTLDGRPVHGPMSESSDYCWQDTPCMPTEARDELEKRLQAVTDLCDIAEPLTDIQPGMTLNASELERRIASAREIVTALQ